MPNGEGPNSEGIITIGLQHVRGLLAMCYKNDILLTLTKVAEKNKSGTQFLVAV